MVMMEHARDVTILFLWLQDHVVHVIPAVPHVQLRVLIVPLVQKGTLRPLKSSHKTVLKH